MQENQPTIDGPFVIDKDLPLTPTTGGQRRYASMPLMEMAVGDSFFVPAEIMSIPTLYSNISRIHSLTYRRFRIEREENGARIRRLDDVDADQVFEKHEFAIEKNVPMSKPRMPSRYSAMMPWDKMEVGDSFAGTYHDCSKSSIRAFAGQYGRKLDRKFAVRSDEKGWRVWRIV